jgi:Protein of unknown function (DUF3347)
MKKILLIVVLILAVFAVYWFKFRGDDIAEGPKQQALKIGRHSAAFNNGFDIFIKGYLDLKAAFVEADTTRVKDAAEKFLVLTDSLNISELKKDTTGIFETANTQAGDVKANTESLVMQKDITEMRKDFSMVSESIYPLLKSVHYEGTTLYWQKCPMAFGEDKEAYWISNTEEIVNPYLGKKHPEYKATMLHCGEVKDSIKAD